MVRGTFPSWLEAWCGAFGATRGFAASLDAALGAELRELGLDQGAFFLAPGAPEIRYSAGRGEIEADLVGPDNFGHPVMVAFSCSRHGGERIDPREALGADCTLDARFVNLPSATLRQRYLVPVAPLVALPAELRERVEWGHVTWPELPLLLEAEGTLATGALDDASRRLEDAIEAWNRRHPNDGADGLQAFERTSERAAAAFVAFGAAPESALVETIGALLDGAPRDVRLVVGRRARP